MNDKNYPSINRSDLLDFLRGQKSPVIDIWNSFVSDLPNELQKEAKTKGFSLIKSPFVEEDGIAQYLIFNINGASKQLQEKTLEMIPCIVCLK